MRIERIELDGFGRFHDATWTLEPGITVFHGANEAGKTTFLNAVRALLFGFEASRDGRTWYPAFEGGKRGGRLVLLTAAGERWVVERHGERGGAGALAVRAPSGNTGGAETLDRLLHGADKDLFNNVFAFGLGELQDMRSLSATAVKGRIYGAGAGLGGASALDLERGLSNELRETWVPSGSKPPLNALIARAEDLRKEIADLVRQPEEHAAAEQERTELAQRAEKLRADALAARERAARARNLMRAAPIAAELSQLEADLAAGDPTLDRFPEDVVATLDRREGEVARTQAVLSTLDEQLAAARAERDHLRPAARILAAADEILALRDERAARVAASAARRDLETEVARYAAELEAQLARVRGWDEPRLLGLDDSIAAVDATRAAEERLTEARGRLTMAEQRARNATDELAAREREVAADVAVDDVERQMAALRQLGDQPDARAETSKLVPVLAAAAAGLVILAGALAIGQPAGGLVLGAAAAMATFLWMRRAAPGVASMPSADRARLLTAAGLAADAGPDAIAKRREELATERARAELAREGRAKLEARRDELRQREADVADARGALEEAEAGWRAWLAEHGLPPELTPDGAREILALATTARRAATERDRARERLTQLDRDEAAYAERARALLARVELPAPADASSLDAAIVGLVDALERNRADSRRANELDVRIAALESKRAPAAEAREEACRAVDAYVAELGCTSVEDLRHRAAAADDRRRLTAQARELRAQLIGSAGATDGVDRLVRDAHDADPARLEAEAAAAADEADRLEAEERDAFARIGALEARIAELEAAEELGTRRQELAMVEGEAAAMARSWAVRAITVRLLQETRARYERERQPDVVRAAEHYFERITGGRYARIVAPPGEDDIRVETEGGLARTTMELSRGTAEQLYLALRFGLIEEFASHAEPLPVVMDDILVNFDPERAARAADAIGDLAKRHQVLFFTCHPAMAELLDASGQRTLRLA